MKVYKRIGAVECIYECINMEYLTWEDVSKLVRDLTDRNMEYALDNFVNKVFPNGVEYFEFSQFIKDEQELIYRELGIDTKE